MTQLFKTIPGSHSNNLIGRIAFFFFFLILIFFFPLSPGYKANSTDLVYFVNIIFYKCTCDLHR